MDERRYRSLRVFRVESSGEAQPDRTVKTPASKQSTKGGILRRMEKLLPVRKQRSSQPIRRWTDAKRKTCSAGAKSYDRLRSETEGLRRGLEQREGTRRDVAQRLALDARDKLWRH